MWLASDLITYGSRGVHQLLNKTIEKLGAKLAEGGISEKEGPEAIASFTSPNIHPWLPVPAQPRFEALLSLRNHLRRRMLTCNCSDVFACRCKSELRESRSSKTSCAANNIFNRSYQRSYFWNTTLDWYFVEIMRWRVSGASSRVFQYKKIVVKT